MSVLKWKEHRKRWEWWLHNAMNIFNLEPYLNGFDVIEMLQVINNWNLFLKALMPLNACVNRKSLHMQDASHRREGTIWTIYVQNWEFAHLYINY